MAKKKSATANKKFKPQHIRNRIPSFEVPPFTGKRYGDFVPDTLDIQERISLAVNGLTGPTDPDKDHLLYFAVNFRSNPPSMTHGPGDICQTKFMEALPLMRLASGSTLNDHVDPIWMATALKTIGPDGLVYWPSLPWATYADWCEPCPRGASHYAIPIFCGRMIGAMTVHSQRDPHGPWNKEIRKVVEGLRNVAIFKDDFAYFPQGGFAPNSKRAKKAAIPLGNWASLSGWTTHGLAQYHRASGYEPAVDLAGRLANYVMFHGKYYGPEGQFLAGWPGEGHQDEKSWATDEQGFNPGPPPITNHIHFQHHMIPLLGAIDHAVTVGDRNLADFVRMAFEWARNKGEPLVGFFPENIDESKLLETSEICEVAGMIGLALKLSAAGIGDYWDDADRWIRNQFAEGQLTRPEWVYRMAEGGLVTGKTRIPPSRLGFGPLDQDTGNEGQMAGVVDTCHCVPERNLGAFAGWSMPNDWFAGHGSGIMHCCTGNGTRALYYIWEHMLHHDRGTLSVNLLLNRPSQWADVHSHLPYAGQVDVHVKKNCRQLRIRIPQWVQPNQARCTVNGRARKLAWEGRYALLGEVVAKDQVTFTFPVEETRHSTSIEKRHYHLIMRGSDVVDIYPRGQFFPLYQRDHYRNEQTRWKKVQRFVSDEKILW